MPKTLEPFLRESDEEVSGVNQNVKNRRKGEFGWNGHRVHKHLKLQLYSSLCILWMGVMIYGCRFPVQVVLNQVLISLYFLIIYAFGIVIAYYVKNNVTVAGVRTAVLLQIVTVFGSGYFEYLGLLSMRQHQENDMNPLTRIWASVLYSIVLLANTTVLTSSLVLTVCGIRICFNMKRRNTEKSSNNCPVPTENIEV